MNSESLFSGELVYNDAAHTYTLDGGSRCKSVTAVADICVDKYNIQLYDKRMVAIGMTLDPNLIERVAANIDNKVTVNDVCDAAKNTAKAHLKADRGSQAHRATEFGDLGQDDRLLTDQQKRDAAAWKRTLEEYRIRVLPGFIEGFVVYPAQNVAGRFDRIATIGAEGDVCAILDLKTGENAVTYPQSTAVQLGLYANAPWVSKTVRTIGDRTTVTSWQRMPDGLDRRWGYVVYLPPEAEVGELWRIDIEHGMAGAGYALSLVQWRKAHDYGKRLSARVAVPTPPTGVVEPPAPVGVEERATPTDRRQNSASVPTAMGGRDADQTVSAAGGGEPGLKPGSGNPSPAVGSTTVDRRHALLARFMELTNEDQDRFRALNINRDDLDAVERALNSIDPFAQVARPQSCDTAALQTSSAAPPALPTPTLYDEGDPVDDATFETLEQLFFDLDEPARMWIHRIITEASQAGVPFIANKSVGRRITRRYELYRGLLTLAAAGIGEDELVRDLVATVLESDAPFDPRYTVGHCVGSLDAGQAHEFAVLCKKAAITPELLNLRDRPVTA